VADENDPPFSKEEQRRKFGQLLDEMDADTRLAFEKLVVWMAERPKGSPPLTYGLLEQMLEEVRLENIRRRLGGKVGEIRMFSRTVPKE
jgi:hypothetical protein